MLRTLGAGARYATAGGASVAAYDVAVNEGSFVSQVVKQLVDSAAKGVPPLPPASVPAISQMTLPSPEMAELSGKLDRLTVLTYETIADRARGGARISATALICMAGVAVGGLAVWAIATGRFWPTVQAKLDAIEAAVGVVEAKVDSRASELSTQMASQHAQVVHEVAVVAEAVKAVDAKVGRLEKRIADMDDVGKENNRGIHILCEVVASNFDLRQCSPSVLTRLHEFSGHALAEPVPPAEISARPLPPPITGPPSARASALPPRQPTSLMQYLVSPHMPADHQARC